MKCEMIFYLGQIGDDPLAALIFVAAIATALVAGISFHEFSHAYVADRLGDKLPRARGRVTLNPLAHLDRTGTMLMVLDRLRLGKTGARSTPTPPQPEGHRSG